MQFKRIARRAGVLVLLLELIAIPVRADSSACPLTGIVGVHVDLGVENDAKTVVIDQPTYQNMVVTMLKSAKVPVTDDNTAPWLQIDINGVQSTGANAIAFTVRTQLCEFVTLPRTGAKTVVVVTWEGTQTVISGRYHANDAVSPAITQEINDFCADYAKDNPKA